MNEWAKNQADAAREYLYGFVGSKDIGKVKDALAALTYEDKTPFIEVGDRIRFDANDEFYHKVLSVHYNFVVVCEDPRAEVWKEDIFEVYTKAEQEANGALVQVFHDGNLGRLGISVFDHSLRSGDFHFLTPEATAALGEFQPVPERNIVLGDAVRWIDANGVPGKVFRYACGHEDGPYVGKLTLVAPEDPAFIAPPVIKEPEPAPMPCEGKVCNCHEITSLDPAPSIPECDTCEYGFTGHGHSATCTKVSIPKSWDLITTGGGRTWQRRGRHWWALDGRGWPLTDAEILEMGPVRRCVPVTLPDSAYSPLIWPTANGNVGHAPDNRGYLTRVEAREIAAQLLAAALEAEEGNV